MKNIFRRIENLEKRFGAAAAADAEAKADREMLAPLFESARRLLKYRELHNIKPSRFDSNEGLPPRKVHTSHGSQLLKDILHEARDRLHLRVMRDRKLKEAGLLPPGDD
jgi:uncharacterized protein YjiS (DUF1127 family)